MSKREVARVLRAALKVMNNKGEHWIQGALRKKVRGQDPAFCSIGGINHVLGRPQTGEAGYRITDENRAVMFALANAIRAEMRIGPLSSLATDREVCGVIYDYNDAWGRTWPDIQRVFRAAAKDPVYPQ